MARFTNTIFNVWLAAAAVIYNYTTLIILMIISYGILTILFTWKNDD